MQYFTSYTLYLRNMRVLVALAIGIVTQVAAQAQCGNGWTFFEEHCYKHFMCGARTHSDAENECVKMGGHLVSINTPEENYFVELIASIGGSLSWAQQPWIGGVRNAAGEYDWTDGSTESGFIWDAGQPSSNGGNNNCLMSRLDNGDSPAAVIYARCSYLSSRFICERDAGVGAPDMQCGVCSDLPPRSLSTTTLSTTTTATTTPPPTTTLEKCASDWVYFAGAGSCYKFVEHRKNVTNAENDCSSMGAHLASIHSLEEDQFIAGLSTERPFHIGLQYIGTGSMYAWADETPYDYSNWSTDTHEPEFLRACTFIDSIEFNVWVADKCHKKESYVCKKPAN